MLGSFATIKKRESSPNQLEEITFWENLYRPCFQN
jgi:hypothetical protein